MKHIGMAALGLTLAVTVPAFGQSHYSPYPPYPLGPPGPYDSYLEGQRLDLEGQNQELQKQLESARSSYEQRRLNALSRGVYIPPLSDR